MSQQNQTRRYPASEALKNGRTVNTIDSSCKKSEIIEEFLRLRKENNDMKPIYEKADVINKQLIQSRLDNETKLKKLTARTKKIHEMNEYIQKQDTHLCQLQNDMKLQKDTSVDRADKQRLEGFLKKKDQQIKELEEKIDSTKINNVEALKNTIHKMSKKIKHLTEGYNKYNLDEDEKIKEENKELKEQNEKYKIYTESLTKIIDEYQEKASLIYDISGPPVAPI